MEVDNYDEKRSSMARRRRKWRRNRPTPDAYGEDPQFIKTIPQHMCRNLLSTHFYSGANMYAYQVRSYMYRLKDLGFFFGQDVISEPVGWKNKAHREFMMDVLSFRYRNTVQDSWDLYIKDNFTAPYVVRNINPNGRVNPSTGLTFANYDWGTFCIYRDLVMKGYDCHKWDKWVEAPVVLSSYDVVPYGFADKWSFIKDLSYSKKLTSRNIFVPYWFAQVQYNEAILKAIMYHTDQPVILQWTKNNFPWKPGTTWVGLDPNMLNLPLQLLFQRYGGQPNPYYILRDMKR